MVVDYSCFSCTMVKTCVAAGYNKSSSDGVSLHKFPNDEVQRKKWIDPVKRHRDKWKPTEYSLLCSLHFEQSCFTADTILTQSLGLRKKKATLKPDAIPTLFTKQVTLQKKFDMDQPPPKKRRFVYEKRDHCRVSLKLSLTSY